MDSLPRCRGDCAVPGVVDAAALHFEVSGMRVLRCPIFVSIVAASLSADPVPVKRMQGFLHGFIVLKNPENQILASGDVTQLPTANGITTTMRLHFKDGSLYEETAAYSQRKT